MSDDKGEKKAPYLTHPLTGELRITQVFIRYDGPRLFLAENQDGEKFLACHIDELPEAGLWFYAPITTTRIESLLNQELPLREVFTNPENNLLYLLRAPYRHDEPVQITIATTEQQNRERWLPKENAYLWKQPIETTL